jgi:MYXO-CTERM domain-containing protein
LVIFIAAGVVGTSAVLSNAGGTHELSDGFAVFGDHITGSTGTLFLDGMVVGAVALLGLALLLGGARRRSQRGTSARRALEQSHAEVQSISQENAQFVERQA